MDDGQWSPFMAILNPTLGVDRRQYFDRRFCWNAVDLPRKLRKFSDYYNADCVRRALIGRDRFRAECRPDMAGSSRPLRSPVRPLSDALQAFNTRRPLAPYGSGMKGR